MGGLTADSNWTHLIPGFIVAGLGAGMVNPPLASTAIGVVPPQKAGMASGVNSTFRQVGIAAGIAALGSIFAAALQRNLSHALAVPSLHASTASAPRVAAMVRQGQVGQLLASLPAVTRGQVAMALRSVFAAGINDLLLVTGALAFAGALCALLLIRSKAPSRGQQSVRTGRTEPQTAIPAASVEAGADSASPARSA
jgi:sugar phosphate permease